MSAVLSTPPGDLWVNIDKKIKTRVLHVSPGCGDVRDRGSGNYKPVGSIGRDGGWLPAQSVVDAVAIAQANGGSLTHCSNCANKVPAFIPFLGGAVPATPIKTKPAKKEAARQRRFFWVNQSGSFKEEIELALIWAPQLDAENNPLPHWSRLLEVREGDVVFHYVHQKIVAVSSALSSGYGVPNKPITTGSWGEGPGYRVDLAYERPQTPVTKAQLVAAGFFAQHAPNLLNSLGNIKQTYLEPLSEGAADYLLHALNFSIGPAPAGSTATELPATETERLRLANARVGQGKFRDDLLQAWGDKCAVTGIAHPRLLRASHIKRWADSTNAERLDPFNGILLAAHIDAAFDAGLISFADDGSVIASSALSSADRELLQLQTLKPAALKAQHLPYLAAHRTRYSL